jgi:hypothetical protein
MYVKLGTNTLPWPENWKKQNMEKEKEDKGTLTFLLAAFFLLFLLLLHPKVILYILRNVITMNLQNKF